MEQNKITSTQIKIKAYSVKEIAEFYGICERTMKTWLIPYEKVIGPKLGRFYTPKQSKIIFEKIGIPQTIELD